MKLPDYIPSTAPGGMFLVITGEGLDISVHAVCELEDDAQLLVGRHNASLVDAESGQGHAVLLTSDEAEVSHVPYFPAGALGVLQQKGCVEYAVTGSDTEGPGL